MSRFVLLTILSVFVITQPIVAEEGTAEYPVRSLSLFQGFIQKGDDYDGPKIEPVYTYYVDGNMLCIEVELPKGLLIPPSFKTYKIKNGTGVIIVPTITDKNAFLDSKNNPLDLFEIRFELIQSDQSTWLSMASTSVVYDGGGWFTKGMKMTNEKKTRVEFTKFSPVSSSVPHFYAFSNDVRLGKVVFEIQLHQ